MRMKCFVLSTIGFQTDRIDDVPEYLRLDQEETDVANGGLHAKSGH